MPDMPERWMPREQWKALVRGEGCPLCPNRPIYPGDPAVTMTPEEYQERAERIRAVLAGMAGGRCEPV